ncbi:MAG TPA: hypothetical protein PKE06_26275 [Flavilitoribacter sp.]|nr:hypothetical protein [Flavilitoribacter sp.]HMQ89071.1 hypothetical protein [Flavilitoribacter sp.]
MKYMLLFVLMAFAAQANGGDGSDHQFHVSKCLIEYSEADHTLQVSMHIFIDDLEEALRRLGADKLFICTKMEDPKAETYVERYIADHLSVTVNGKKQNFTFIGKEPSEDLVGVWCYLESGKVDAVRDVSLKFDLLMEAFDDQKNLVSILGPKKQQGSFLFEKGAAEDKISF